MKKRKLLIPILAGLIVGQIFAEGNRPFSIINQLRFGYDDNPDREQDGGKGSFFVEDTVKLAFNASLSDRTDLVVKSQVSFKTDKENKIHPNLYAVLSHAVSPRLMFRFSEKFRSADKTSGGSGQHDYYNNNLGVAATYVLTQKDRLELFANHQIRRHDEEIEDDDSTTLSAGVSWMRDIRPQRTRSKLSLTARTTEYDKRSLNGTKLAGGVRQTLLYDGSTSGFDALDLTLEVNHTFNPEWQGTIQGGFTHRQLNKRDYWITEINGTPVFPILKKADNTATLSPMLSLGATYSPSPRTRFTGNFSHIYDVSNDSDYVGSTADEFRFGVQHDVTAKIMAKATAG